jgi:GDP-4-dehydro-6-deoxy-D-mannose reductase
MIEFMNGNVENGDIFHIAGNDLHSMQHYLDLMLDLANLRGLVRLEIEPKFFRKVEIPVQIPDDSKVRELLNWAPTIPIEKTLEDLLNYWLGEI